MNTVTDAAGRELTRLPRSWSELVDYFRPDPTPDDLDLKLARRVVITIVMPALVELILSSLTSMFDTIMVGKLGSWAISAVGLTTQPKFLMLTCFVALNSGATAMIARFRGQDDPVMANRTMHQSIIVTFFLSIIIGAIGYAFAETFVRFMGGIPGETLEGGTQYFRIQMLGFPTQAIALAITAALRGIGKTRVSMVYNIVANVVNIFFNYCFILGHWGFPRLELAGASLATVIGQFVSMVIALVSVSIGAEPLRLRLKMLFKVDFSIIGRIMKIGFPAMLEQLFMRAGMIIYSKIVASLGTDQFATHTICMNILSMSFMPGQAFAIAATTMVGQSLGRKRIDHAKAYVKLIRLLGFIFSLLLAAGFIFFGKNIVGLYTQDAWIIQTGAGLLMIVAAIQPLQSTAFILNGALRGAGDTRSTAIIIFIGAFVVRGLVGILTVKVFGWGLTGAWLTLAFDQTVRSLAAFWRYKLGKWKYIKV